MAARSPSGRTTATSTSAVGDGGGGNDPDNNGQNTNTLLGTVLRLDVNGDDFPADDGRNYAIPTDNPFVGASGADEIWAYGLRNAWRISFDQNGDLYIADVGQSAREEVNFQPFDSPGGDNYGWDLAEGTLGNPPPGSKLPVFEYDHSQGVAITGGYVYHGGEPSFDGAYVFADFGSARFWTLKIEGGAAVDTTERTGQIDSPDAALTQICLLRRRRRRHALCGQPRRRYLPPRPHREFRRRRRHAARRRRRRQRLSAGRATIIWPATRAKIG